MLVINFEKKIFRNCCDAYSERQLAWYCSILRAAVNASPERRLNMSTDGDLNRSTKLQHTRLNMPERVWVGWQESAI